jgi:hypothetical protein
MAAIDPNAKSAAPPRATAALLPPGPYLVGVKWVEKTMSSTNKDRLTFTFEVLAGEHKGKTVREDCYLTAGAVYKVKLIAQALGITSAFDPDNAKGLISTFVGTGKELKIVLSVDTSNPSGVEGRSISQTDSMDPAIKKVMDAERAARFGGAKKPAAAAAPAGPSSVKAWPVACAVVGPIGSPLAAIASAQRPV